MENTPNGQNQPKKDNNKQKVMAFALVEAGIEFALLIGLPLGFFIWLGKLLDAKLGTHFIVLIGILFAISVSCMAIYKRINDYKNLMK